MECALTACEAHRVIQPYPIDKSLPAEVATAASQLLQYLRYPVFSWPWWWRRMVFFAPLAAVIAIANGNDHGEFAHSASEGLAVAWRAAIVSTWFVGGGALIATLIRHAGLRQDAERALIVIAIITGFFIAESADRWVSRYHNELMCAHRGQVDCPSPVKRIDDTALGLLLRFAVPAGLYFAFGGGFALVSYFKEQRSWREHEQRQERERLQLAKTESDLRLSILQAQVEPHFLFNTLASLRSLIQSEPHRAEVALDALVDHLRATLPSMRDGGAASRSTLAQQVEICRSYLEVMRIRIGARFSYAIEVPAALGDVPFPPFILISLVENAMKHGVERKPGACKVTIAAVAITAPDQSLLEISVTDDGAGLQEGLGTGVGLSNIRAQLALRFGADASLCLRSGATGGAIAALRIPLPSRP
jgi:signal transduction histidine kinase